MQGLIKAATFDQKTMYNQLNLNELEDIAFEVEAIKLAPSKFRNNAVELIRRKSYGPPVNTFARLGLEHQYSNVMSGIYTRNEWYNQAALWLVDTKQQFKKQFNKTWDIDSKVDEAMSYAAEGVKYESLPDDILDEVTGEEFAFLLDKAIEDRDNFLDPLADIAEAQGKISSDPLQIAAGVPPRVENYYHRIHDDISGYMMKRIKDAEEAGRKISVPVDYDLDKLIREGHIPEGRDIGEWIARDATKDNYSRSYSRVRQVYAREVTHDLFARPEVVRLKAAIDALPVAGELRVTAKTAARKWSIQILNQPTSIDTTLNKAFNWTSRQMEKIIPKWEAQERSFENFSRFTSRRIDQGLLAGNPRPAIRNLFQPLLTTNIYGHRATLWGYQQLLTPGGKKLLGTSQVYLGRGVPLAAFDVTNAKSWTQLTYLGIKATDKYLNVATSYLAGWRYYFRRSPKAWDELVAFAKTQDITESSLRRGSTFSGTVADAVDAGMFREVRRTIDFRGIGNTQWHYDSASMPPSLTSSAGKLAGKYTSWTQYMWGAHMPQMMDQLVHGKDIFGMKASPAVRGALFGTAAKGLMLAALGNELGVNMSHLAVTGSLPETYVMGSRFPVPMSPVLTGGLGIGAMAIGALKMDSGYMDAGWKQFVRSSKAMIPLYGVGRQIERVRKGEQPAAGILWPLPKQKKDKDKAILKGVPSIKSIPSIPGFPGLSKGI